MGPGPNEQRLHVHDDVDERELCMCGCGGAGLLLGGEHRGLGGDRMSGQAGIEKRSDSPVDQQGRGAGRREG